MSWRPPWRQADLVSVIPLLNTSILDWKRFQPSTGCPEDDLFSNVAGIPGILSPIKLIFHMLNKHMMRFFLVYKIMVLRLICLGKYGATLEHVGKSQNPDSCVSG